MNDEVEVLLEDRDPYYDPTPYAILATMVVFMVCCSLGFFIYTIIEKLL